jgi:4-hydroxy-tetrahydrodipicolinate reductase
MSELKLAVLGAGGRMGRALITAIAENPKTVLSGALERDGSEVLGKDAGTHCGLEECGVTITTDLDGVLNSSDGIIDFTAPAASVELAKKIAGFDCFHIIGTTGCTADDEDMIRKAGQSATIVKSGNMSLGVNLLAILVEQAAKALEASDFDIEVLEMHHKHKVDAPSGTALLLGEAAATGRGIDLDQHAVRVRDGITGAREDGSIGFATLRGGAVIGDHSVMFASANERLELTHRAQDRSLFAAGAITAALWAKNKAHGFYSMRDVLGL